eukprot:TRINITY_DN63_c0_g1_i1.p1 TRINITY_DN63_c0_g1~~TRINITY_DN63_c0_g1_i1.p1  ORF type:complete len:453 (-),score=148.39 TRINITY_DN63_c0_g1_i1:52-1410(-)
MATEVKRQVKVYSEFETASDVFANFPDGSIEFMFAESKVKSRTDRNLDREQMVQKIAANIMQRGSKCAVSVFKKWLLRDMSENVSEDFLHTTVDGVDRNPILNKLVLKKRLGEKMAEEGVESFFKDTVKEKSVLINVMKALELPYNRKDTVANMAEDIEKEVITLGLLNFFNYFHENNLRALVDDLNLDAVTSSKAILTDCILENRSYYPTEQEVDDVAWRVATGKETKIYADMTKKELMHFTVADLTAKLIEYELETSGKKTSLATRLYEYFQEDKENWTKSDKRSANQKSATKPSKARRRASSGRPAKRNPKKEASHSSSHSVKEEAISSEEEEVSHSISSEKMETNSSFDSVSEEENSFDDDATVTKKQIKKRVYCISGNFEISTSSIQEMIEDLGGKCTSKYDNEVVTHLVLGNGYNPKKLRYALEDDIPILNDGHIAILEEVYNKYF